MISASNRGRKVSVESRGPPEPGRVRTAFSDVPFLERGEG